MNWLARRSLALCLCLGFASGCASVPRPAVLYETERSARSPASQEAAKLVPQAFARAEQLRTQADQAYERGETSAATILAERALVAYEHAAVLAEIVRATKIAASAKEQLSKAEASLRDLDAEQARLAAEADALELKIKVIKDAEPVAASGKADPERETARLAAARSIALDARLLCIAARLIDAGQAGLAEAETEVQKLEGSLEGSPRPAPIDQARRSRAKCLSLLTGARRASAATPSSGKSDLVLAEVSSKTSLAPFRDDRGVVVPLPSEYATKPGDREKSVLSTLAAVANSHPEFPILVVSHARAPGAPADLARARSSLETLSKTLVAAGLKPERIRPEQGGIAQTAPGKAGSVERFELVFVSPGS